MTQPLLGEGEDVTAMFSVPSVKDGDDVTAMFSVPSVNEGKDANAMFSVPSAEDGEDVTSQFNASAAPPAKPDTSFSSAIMQGIDAPLEAIGITAQVLGAQTIGKAIRGMTEAPVNYESASEQFSNPKEGDFTVPSPFGDFAPAQIPRAITEQFGQLTGSLISRVAGGIIGGAIGGGGGTAAGSVTGPGAAVTGGIGLGTGAVVGQFAGPFLFGALQIIGPTALERAKRNGRTDPNGEDIAASLVTAAGSGSLDALGAQYLPGGKKLVGSFVKRLAGAFYGESVTEAMQSVAEQTGESLGTKEGLKISLKQAFGEGMIGGISGSGATAISEPFRPADTTLVKTAPSTAAAVARTQPVTVTVPEVATPTMPSGSLGPPDPIVVEAEAAGAPQTAAALNQTMPPKPFAPRIEEPGTPTPYGRETDVFDITTGLQRKPTPAAPAALEAAAVSETSPRVFGGKTATVSIEGGVATKTFPENQAINRPAAREFDVVAEVARRAEANPPPTGVEIIRPVGKPTATEYKMTEAKGVPLEDVIQEHPRYDEISSEVIAVAAKYLEKIGVRAGDLTAKNVIVNGALEAEIDAALKDGWHVDYSKGTITPIDVGQWRIESAPTPTAPAAPETAPVAAPAPSRIQLRSGPATYSVVEQLAPQKGDQPGEVYFRVKNEQTGEEQTVEAGDMKPIKAKVGAVPVNQPAPVVLPTKPTSLQTKTAVAKVAAKLKTVVKSKQSDAKAIKADLIAQIESLLAKAISQESSEAKRIRQELAEANERKSTKRFIETLQAQLANEVNTRERVIIRSPKAGTFSITTQNDAVSLQDILDRISGMEVDPKPYPQPKGPSGGGSTEAKLQAEQLVDLIGTEEAIAEMLRQKAQVKGVAAQKMFNDTISEIQKLPKNEGKAVGMKRKLRGSESGAIPASLFADIADFGARIYRDGMSFARWSADMVRHLGERVRSALKELWVGILNPKGARNLRGEVIQKRDQGGAIGAAGGRAEPQPGAPVEGGREGEYYTRVAERDKGTLSDNAWNVVRNRTTLPDSFKEDVDEAAKILLQTNDGDLRSALDRSKEMSASGLKDYFSGLTDRRKAALLFLIAQNAATQRETATDPKQIAALKDVEAEAIADFSDLMSQGGKLLNIAGQLYAAMPMSPDAQVMAAEKLLARMTGGKAAEAEAEQVSTEVKKRVRKATDKALEEASKESSDKEDSINQRAANSILNRYSKIQSDTPTWDKSLDENPVRKAFREQVEKPKSIKEFVAILKGLDVDTRTAEVLFNVADRETRSRKAVQMAKDSSMLSDEEKSALRIIERQAKQDSDTPGWPKATEDPVFLLFSSEARIGRRTEADFMQAAMALGVSERKAKQLYDAAKRENKNIEAARKQAGVRDALDAEISSVIREAEISIRNIILNKRKSSWGEVVEQLAAAIQSAIPDVSAARAEEMASRIRERLEKLFNAERANMLATEAKRGKKGNRSSLDKLWKLFEMGALDDEAMTKVFMEKAGVQEFTPAFRDKLKKMYEDAEKAPEGMPRDRILGNIAVEIALANPKTFGFWWNLAMSISYGNILGAFTTIFVNNPLGSLATSLEMTAMGSLSNKGARAETFKGAVKTWARSFGDGVAMMRDLWSTGENLQKISQFDSALVNSPVELLAKMAEDPSYPKAFRAAAKAVSQYKWIMRSMMAADAVIRWPAREALRFTQSAAIAKDTRRPGQSLEDAVDELNYPGGRPAAVREARTQAANERKDGTLKTKLDERLRVIQLLQSKLSAEGTEAATESDELANYGSLLNDQPQDFIGVIASAILKIAFPSNTKSDLQKALGGAAQPFVRFVRTSANATRVMLDYAVGYGAFRYMTRNWPVIGAESLAGGVNLVEGRAGDRITQVRIQRAYLGIALYAGLAAIYAAIDDDDEDPYIDFIGSGPTTPDERRRVRESGVRLNSIKIGNTYVPTNVGPLQPLAGILAPFQRMRDNKKYPKGTSDIVGEKVPEMAGVAVAKGIADAMMNQSFTRSLADLLTIANTGKTSFGETPQEFFGKSAAQFIPGNLRGLSQLDEIVNGKKERADGFFDTAANSIAFYAPNGRATTILGDEVDAGKSVAQKAGEKVFQFTTLADDKTLQFVVKNGLSIPDRQPKPSNGKRQTYPEYSAYMRESGKMMRNWLETKNSKTGKTGMEMLQSIPEEVPGEKGKPINLRKKEMNKLWSEFRQVALLKQ